MKRKTGNLKRGKLLARKQRVARGIGASDRARLTVYRSSRHVYAMLVDAESGRTVTSTSTRSKAVADGLKSTGNVEAAKRVGKAIAELALERQIEEVVFNRNGFLYHGRVKALAEAAREAGLRF
jgi:large subunit ribosomal protein L18